MNILACGNKETSAFISATVNALCVLHSGHLDNELYHFVFDWAPQRKKSWEGEFFQILCKHLRLAQMPMLFLELL